ncbi:MAG: PPOX class F420-dependent oxidoreductase [Candidatus Hodarchaeota archaeon]
MVKDLTVLKEIYPKKAFAHVATIGKDGSPQVSPVWIDFDEETGLIQFNTAKGRVKEKNLRRDKRVAISILDPDNPYSYVGIRGEVVEITERDADANIDKLAKKYLGLDKYPYRRPGEIRLVVKVKPISVAAT